MMRTVDSVLEEVGDQREVRDRTCTAAMLIAARRTCRVEEALVKELRPDKRAGTTRTVHAMHIPYILQVQVEPTAPMPEHDTGRRQQPP